MKNYFLLLLLVMFSSSIVAQETSKRAIDEAEGQQWWGYYKGSEELRGMGYGTRGHYDVAIFIPGNEGIGQGATIHAVRFYLTTNQELNNVKVWASKQLPTEGHPETADIEMKSLAQNDFIVRSEGTNDVAFTPFQVPEEGVYVGYSFDITSIGSPDTYYPVVVTKGTDDINNALWLYVSSNTSWVNCYDWGGNYGNLALKVLVSGNMKANAAEAVSAEETVVMKGETARVPLKIFNWGSEGISSLGYTVTTDGTESNEMTYSLDNPFTVFHSDTTIFLPVPSDEMAVKKQKTITLKKVNGQPNDADATQQSTDLSLITVDKQTQRNVVMEEFTGTWCGWCVRGLKGIELSSTLFGDQFIPIAVHGGNDLMTIPEYYNLRMSVGGLPTSLLNRYFECDPYYGSRGIDLTVGSQYGVDADIRSLLEETIEGGVATRAMFTDNGKTAISLSSETTFQFSSDDAPYALGYVLLANELEGAGSAWVQENYYPRYKDNDKYNQDENLLEYINGDERITDMVYQHVPVAGLGVDNGIEGSISAPISSSQSQSYSSRIDIADNSLIQDKGKLEVVTFLFNTETGRIVNAHKTAVADYDPSSIQNSMTSDSRQVQIFTLDGRKQTSVKPGINIIKMADGTWRKQIIR